MSTTALRVRGRFAQVVVGVLLAIGLVGCNAIKMSKYEDEVMSIANQFLKIMDDGHYRDAYFAREVSLFDDATRFEAYASTRRLPLGGAINRRIWGSTYLTEFPGKPDGEYMDVRFKTEFESKKNGWEGVLLRKIDNRWNVVQYFVM